VHPDIDFLDRKMPRLIRTAVSLRFLRRHAGLRGFRAALLLLATAVTALDCRPAGAVTYYVRQTVGDDTHDGLTAATAWKHFSRLSEAMNAGDTAFVGPGLYREQVTVAHDGTADGRITFIADTTGQQTGDPPGVVMVTGAEPGPLDRYPSLADYQKAKGEDMHSRAGSCGTLPPKFDVHALHAAALAYPAPPARAQTAGVRGWLDWVLRR
jgi:hypothetical protein